jgi:transcriptional regulator with XRE-family HTH domain
VSALSEYVSGLSIDKGMSIRGLADLTGISTMAASRLVKGIGKPTDETLERVATKLPGASLRRMRELADRSDVKPFEVPREFDQLTYAERRTVIQVGRQILASSGRLDQGFDSDVDEQENGVTRIHSGDNTSE